MAGLDPAIHVSPPHLVDMDARIKSGHDENNWRVGETARPTRNHANFRNRTLVGVISGLGRLVGVPTPSIDMVYALVKQRAVEAGCLVG